MNTVMAFHQGHFLPGRLPVQRVMSTSVPSFSHSTTHLIAGDMTGLKAGMQSHGSTRRLRMHAAPEENTSSGAVLHSEAQQQEQQHQEPEEEAAAAGPAAEEAPAVANLASKFGGNSQFAAVLQTALKRTGGTQSLLSSPASSSTEHEPPRPTALEEVLLAALRDSRRNILMLEDMLKSMEGALDREQKQFDRLHFAYKKAESDAAYARTMEKLLQRERAKNSGSTPA